MFRLIIDQSLVSWNWCLVWWICWSCKLFNLTSPDLLFQRLSTWFSSSKFITLLITGRGGSIFSILIGTIFSFLWPFWWQYFLETSPLFTDTRGLLPQVEGAVTVAVVLMFLPEKSFLSLEYFPIGDDIEKVLLLVMKLILWEDGNPDILLFFFTWPMQPILGDKGSLEKDLKLSLHCGRHTSFIDLEHSIGKNVFLWLICKFWLWK